MALAESYAPYNMFTASATISALSGGKVRRLSLHEVFSVWGVACSALWLINEILRYNFHVVKFTLFRDILCHNQNMKVLITPKVPWCPGAANLLRFPLQVPGNYRCSVPQTTHHVDRITQYVAVWRLPLGIMCLRFIHVFVFYY